MVMRYFHTYNRLHKDLYYLRHISCQMTTTCQMKQNSLTAVARRLKRLLRRSENCNANEKNSSNGIIISNPVRANRIRTPAHCERSAHTTNQQHNLCDSRIRNKELLMQRTSAFSDGFFLFSSLLKGIHFKSIYWFGMKWHSLLYDKYMNNSSFCQSISFSFSLSLFICVCQQLCHLRQHIYSLISVN